MHTASLIKMTAEDFLVWERAQEQRHEFDSGEVFAMSGGSPRHNALCAAVIFNLVGSYRDGKYRVFTSDQRVSLRFRDKYVYPDISVVCGPLELEAGSRDVATNPSVIVEVLSASSEAHDRGNKWDGYRRLASLEDYLLVSQRSASVEHFQRQADGSWRYSVAGPGELVALANGAFVDVDRVYQGVFELPGDDGPAQHSA